jgi:hypothetical protein
MWIRSRIFQSVKTNSVAKWAARTLGLVFVGALGSGLWDAALKPVLLRASYGLMTLSSLGIESFRTGTYEWIATGSTGWAGVETLALVTGLLITLSGAAFVYVFLNSQELQSKQKLMDGHAGAFPRPSPEEIRKLNRRYLKYLRRMVYFIGVILLLFAGMLFVGLSRASYEFRAVVHFQQALKIASPYLSDTDRSMVESKFAQIHSKSEYVAIVGDLAKTANDHGQHVPAFNAW